MDTQPPPVNEAAETLSGAVRDLRDIGGATREAILAVFRRHLSRLQDQVRDAFEAHRLTGAEAAQSLAAIADGLVATLFDHGVLEVGVAGEPTLAVVATGGYGSFMLAPFSDVDLLFLTEAGPGPRTLKLIEFLLYFLWDLGLKVGHATRSIPECLDDAASELTIATALLDARRVAGDGALVAELRERLAGRMEAGGAGAFIAGKQAERALRHRRFGESAYLVEPNVKEGRGGLRDLQTLSWMTRASLGVGDFADLAEALPGALTPLEVKHAGRSSDFLWTLRLHMHYVSGRAEERLTFDLQPVVGARMGYTRHGRQDGVERFMRHYFLTARDVTRLARVLEPALVRATMGAPALQPDATGLAEAGFALAEGELLPLHRDEFEHKPMQMLRMLQVARDRSLALHPLAIRSLIRHERGMVRLRDDPRAGALFLDLLCGTDAEGKPDGAHWLGVMNETGMLGRLLPDWARIVGQMQFDSYHIFTVDQHTIEAVRVLNTLEQKRLSEVAPVATGLVEDLQSRRALYVAVLLHDIAKGRGGDHSILGAEVAQTLCPQLGLSAEETEMVSWLVLHHLLLSQTAFRRDIDDPKTILDVADTIQSPERLRLLLVLTVADMRAVSARVWNGWKATLLREIYARVGEVLAGGLSTPERDVRVTRARDAAARALTEAGWNEPDRLRYLSLGYPGYWLSFDTETHLRHAAMIREAEAAGAPLTVRTQPLPQRSVTEVIVYTADHAGLFSRIAGALAVAGASIVDARIHTLTSGMALDTFWVQDASGGALDAPHRLARLAALIEQALSGQLRLRQEMARLGEAMLGRRTRAINVPPRVVLDNRASNSHTVVEVNGRDRPGLLHDVTAAISAQGLQIASAHVSTYGVRAVDVFYVKDVFGLKIDNERKLAALREALLGALAQSEPAQAA